MKIWKNYISLNNEILENYRQQVREAETRLSDEYNRLHDMFNSQIRAKEVLYNTAQEKI